MGRRTRRWGNAVWRGALGALAMVSALALALAWMVTAAHAAGGCGTTQACIHWSSNMIYAGRNNGYPEGPVGEHAMVSGVGFLANAGQKVSLRLVKGDVNVAPESAFEFCKLATPRVGGVAKGVTVNSSGAFSASFDWPAAASSGDWSVCAIGLDGLPASEGNRDDGPFHVMSSHAPSLALSSATVNPGGSVTVSGHNWLPGQDQIFVYAGLCANCAGAPLASNLVISNAGGDFATTLTFDASATPGTYIVSAHNQNGVLDSILSGPRVTVTQAPTVTPAPTATALPTATTASGGRGGSTSVDGSPDSASGLSGALPLLLGVGGALALLGVAIYFLVGRKPPTAPPDGPRSGLDAPPEPPTSIPAGPNDVTEPNLPLVESRG